MSYVYNNLAVQYMGYSDFEKVLDIHRSREHIDTIGRKLSIPYDNVVSFHLSIAQGSKQLPEITYHNYIFKMADWEHLYNATGDEIIRNLLNKYHGNRSDHRPIIADDFLPF